MKNIVRAFVIALTLTGAVASAHTVKTNSENVKPTLLAGFPTPMCPPNDPNACGMGGNK
ncbi:MAG: hypothetical protein ABI197_05135 [Granulicella sp.]